MKSIKIDLPKVIEVDDYHYFQELEENLISLSGQSVKVKELDESMCIHFEANYVGIIYIGKLPTNEEIKKLKSVLIC